MANLVEMTCDFFLFYKMAFFRPDNVDNVFRWSQKVINFDKCFKRNIIHKIKPTAL